MQIVAPWIPASKPPEVEQADYEFKSKSVPVLGGYKTGGCAVVYYVELYDDDGSVLVSEWRTDDSECWDVTKDVAAWTPLPAWPA